MFTISQIKDAHSKVKSGADFPRYVQDIIVLGVTGYSTYVTDSHTEYYGENGYSIKSPARYDDLSIAGEYDIEKFRHYLKIHQQGQTDYLGFCRHCAETGVEKWVVDMKKMTCTYYSASSVEMLAEEIPVP